MSTPSQPFKAKGALSAPLAAMMSSIATLGCCVPMGFAAALGAGATSAFWTAVRPWLLAVSLLLLALGFWQQRRATQCAPGSRWISNALLWSAVAVWLAVALIPQEIAGFLANRIHESRP